MAQPQPATLDLVDDGSTDKRLRWYRHYEIEIKITSDGSTGINLASLYSTYQVEVRTSDSTQAIVCTGATDYTTAAGNGSGTDGWIRVKFPATGWATTGEADMSCVWDLVGKTSGNNSYQLVEGRADTLRTATVLS